MRDRIAESTGFLLVCTPGVLQSKYVRRELEIRHSLPGKDSPLAAVLSASPAEVAPDYFTADQVAADLAPPENVTRQEWRALLRRESHKIVARVWGLNTSEVYDRFEAARHRRRVQAIYAGVILALLIGALIIGLKGDAGLHRIAVLPISEKLVAPAGIGFASDGGTPVVINSDKALIWSNGRNRPPRTLPLPFPVLYATPLEPGTMVIAGLNELAVISIPSMQIRMRTVISGRIGGICAQGDEVAVATESGALFFVENDGRLMEAPRPPSTTGRRFRAFRERTIFDYGSLLALEDKHYLASATLTGHLGLLDRRRNDFVNARKPQFPLVAPVEPRREPILYETENTRPIGALVFLSDSTLIFSEGEGLRRLQTATGVITPLSHCPIELVRQIIPTSDRRALIVFTSSTLEVLRFKGDDSGRLECKQRTPLAPKFAPIASMAPDGETILIAFFDGEPELWHASFRLWGLDLRLPNNFITALSAEPNFSPLEKPRCWPWTFSVSGLLFWYKSCSF